MLFYSQLICLLLGFTDIITQTSGMRCYKETTVGGSQSPGTVKGEVDCPDGDDRCGTLTFKLDTLPFLLRYCLKSSECEEGCHLTTMSAEKDNLGTVSECLQTCCESDLCNAPGKEESMR